MAALLNFIAPTLLVVSFYLILGAIIWWILHPSHLRLPQILIPQNLALPDQTVRMLTHRLPKDAISHQTLRLAAILAAVGIVGLLVPFPLPMRLLAAQAFGASFLLLWFDNYYKQRQKQVAREALFNALRSPDVQVAHTALLNAQQQGWFSDGTLADQDFSHAQWAGAKLNGASLPGVDFTNADLSGADLRHANLNRAILNGTLLATADLTGATLVGAQLIATQAKAANLHRATCQWANLDGAMLQKANLTYANLNNTTLCQANLKQALMVGIELKDAQFDTATKWPKHFYPGLAGAKQVMQPQIPAQDSFSQILPEHSDA